MPLEQQIEALNQSVVEQTIALRDLIAVLKRQAYVEATQPAEIPGFDKPVEALGVKTESSATGAAEQDPAITTAVKTEQPAPASAAEVDYATAAAAVTKLSRTRGRDAAVALLARFGAAKLPDVDPAQFAAVVAAVEAELNATEKAA